MSVSSGCMPRAARWGRSACAASAGPRARGWPGRTKGQSGALGCGAAAGWAGGGAFFACATSERGTQSGLPPCARALLACHARSPQEPACLHCLPALPAPNSRRAGAASCQQLARFGTAAAAVRRPLAASCFTTRQAAGRQQQQQHLVAGAGSAGRQARRPGRLALEKQRVGPLAAAAAAPGHALHDLLTPRSCAMPPLPLPISAHTPTPIPNLCRRVRA